jgi:hypothetical protein
MRSGAPTITQQPQGRSVLEGSNFTFRSPRRNRPVSYQWRFNGTNLASATSAQLAFTPVALSNAGLYQVVVSNSVGSVTSAVAQLVVRSTNDRFMPHQMAAGITFMPATPQPAADCCVDGTWNHSNGDDSWSGDGRGAGNGCGRPEHEQWSCHD